MNYGERYLRLGDMLLQRGEINQRKLTRALKVAQESNRRLGDVLTELRYAPEEVIAQCLADQYGFHYQNPTDVTPDPKALAKLTPDFALKWCVLPLEEGEKFTCIVADPLNVELSDTLSAIARKSVVFHLAGKYALQRAIRAAYKLPVPQARKGRRKPPQPESVMQRDRTMLLDAVHAELGFENPMRRAS